MLLYELHATSDELAKTLELYAEQGIDPRLHFVTQDQENAISKLATPALKTAELGKNIEANIATVADKDGLRTLLAEGYGKVAKKLLTSPDAAKNGFGVDILEQLAELSKAAPTLQPFVEAKVNALDALVPANKVAEFKDAMNKLTDVVLDADKLADRDVIKFNKEKADLEAIGFLAGGLAYVSTVKAAAGAAAGGERARGDHPAVNNNKEAVRAAIKVDRDTLKLKVDATASAFVVALNEANNKGDNTGWAENAENIHAIAVFNDKKDAAHTTYEALFAVQIKRIEDGIATLKASKYEGLQKAAEDFDKLTKDVDTKISELRASVTKALADLRTANTDAIARLNKAHKEELDAVQFIVDFRARAHRPAHDGDEVGRDEVRHDPELKKVTDAIALLDDLVAGGAKTMSEHTTQVGKVEDAIRAYIDHAAAWDHDRVVKTLTDWEGTVVDGSTNKALAIPAHNDVNVLGSHFAERIKKINDEYAAQALDAKKKDDFAERADLYSNALTTYVYTKVTTEARKAYDDLVILRLEEGDKAQKAYDAAGVTVETAPAFVREFIAADANNANAATDAIAAVRAAKHSEMVEKVRLANDALAKLIEDAFAAKKASVMGAGGWDAMTANADVVRFDELAKSADAKIAALKLSKLADAKKAIEDKLALNSDDLLASNGLFVEALREIAAHQTKATDWVRDNLTAHADVFEAAKANSVQQLVGDVWGVNGATTLDAVAGNFNGEDRSYADCVANLKLVGIDLSAEVTKVNTAVTEAVAEAVRIEALVGKDKDIAMFNFIHSGFGGHATWAELLDSFVNASEAKGEFAKLRHTIKEKQYHIETSGHKLKATSADSASATDAEVDAFADEILAAFNLGAKDAQVYTSVDALYNHAYHGDWTAALKVRISHGTAEQVAAKQNVNDNFVAAYVDVEAQIGVANNPDHKAFNDLYDAVAVLEADLGAANDALNGAGKALEKVVAAKGFLKVVADTLAGSVMVNVEADLLHAQNPANFGDDATKTLDGLKAAMNTAKGEYDAAIKDALKAAVTAYNKYKNDEIIAKTKLSSNNDNKDVFFREGLDELLALDTRQGALDGKNALDEDTQNLDKAAIFEGEFALRGKLVELYKAVTEAQKAIKDRDAAHDTLVALRDHMTKGDAEAGSFAQLNKALNDAVKAFTDKMNEVKAILIARKAEHDRLAALEAQNSTGLEDDGATVTAKGKVYADMAAIDADAVDKFDATDAAFAALAPEYQAVVTDHIAAEVKKAHADAIAAFKLALKAAKDADAKFNAEETHHVIDATHVNAHAGYQFSVAKEAALIALTTVGHKIGNDLKAAITKAHADAKIVADNLVAALAVENAMDTQLATLGTQVAHLKNLLTDAEFAAADRVFKKLTEYKALKAAIALNKSTGEAHTFADFLAYLHNAAGDSSYKTSYDDIMTDEPLDSTKEGYAKRVADAVRIAQGKVKTHFADTVGNAGAGLTKAIADLGNVEFIDLTDGVVFGAAKAAKAAELRAGRDAIKLDAITGAATAYAKVLAADAATLAALPEAALDKLAQLTKDFDRLVHGIYAQIAAFQKEVLLAQLEHAPDTAIAGNTAHDMANSLKDHYEAYKKAITEKDLTNKNAADLLTIIGELNGLKDQVKIYQLGLARETKIHEVAAANELAVDALKHVAKGAGLAEAFDAFGDGTVLAAGSYAKVIYDAIQAKELKDLLDLVNEQFADGKPFGKDTINAAALAGVKALDVAGLKVQDKIDVLNHKVNQTWLKHARDTMIAFNNAGGVDPLNAALNTAGSANKDALIKEITDQIDLAGGAEFNDAAVNAFADVTASNKKAKELHTIEKDFNTAVKAAKDAVILKITELKDALKDVAYPKLGHEYKRLVALVSTEATSAADLEANIKAYVVYGMACRAAKINADSKAVDFCKYDAALVAKVDAENSFNDDLSLKKGLTSRRADIMANVIVKDASYDDENVLATLGGLDIAGSSKNLKELETEIGQFTTNVSTAIAGAETNAKAAAEKAATGFVTELAKANVPAGLVAGALFDEHKRLADELVKAENTKTEVEKLKTKVEFDAAQGRIGEFVKEAKQLEAAIKLHNHIRAQVNDDDKGQLQALAFTAATDLVKTHDFGAGAVTFAVEEGRVKKLVTDLAAKIANGAAYGDDKILAGKPADLTAAFDAEVKAINGAHTAYQTAVADANKPVVAHGGGNVAFDANSFGNDLLEEKKTIDDLEAENIEAVFNNVEDDNNYFNPTIEALKIVSNAEGLALSQSLADNEYKDWATKVGNANKDDKKKAFIADAIAAWKSANGKVNAAKEVFQKDATFVANTVEQVNAAAFLGRKEMKAVKAVRNDAALKAEIAAADADDQNPLHSVKLEDDAAVGGGAGGAPVAHPLVVTDGSVTIVPANLNRDDKKDAVYAQLKTLKKDAKITLDLRSIESGNVAASNVAAQKLEGQSLEIFLNESALSKIIQQQPGKDVTGQAFLTEALKDKKNVTLHIVGDLPVTEQDLGSRLVALKKVGGYDKLVLGNKGNLGKFFLPGSGSDSGAVVEVQKAMNALYASIAGAEGAKNNVVVDFVKKA